MNRVLVTGGAGTIGAAVVRRLLRDPAWEVRVSDQRPAPVWMREGCEVHTGDLRELADVEVHDPVVATPTASFDDAVTGADVVVVATNHSAYSNAEALGAIARTAAPDCLVVDPWNAFGAAQVFAYASEVAALSAR